MDYDYYKNKDLLLLTQFIQIIKSLVLDTEIYDLSNDFMNKYFLYFDFFIEKIYFPHIIKKDYRLENFIS